MSRVLLLCIALLVASSAHAAEDFRRANTVAIAGGVATALAGPALGAGSLMIMPGPEHTDGLRYEIGLGVYASGFAFATGGGGMLSIGSLASRAAVRRAGGRVTAAPGVIATGLWATGVAFAYAVPVVSDFHAPGWVAIGTYASVLVLGSTQLAINQRAHRRLRDKPQSVRGLSIGLSPQLRPDGGGLSLQGAW